jgi:Gas vesicle synthesis protein GvpL/GvpF
MPVLAYCITEPEPQIKVPSAGVQGCPIKTLEDSGLRCFVSQYDEQPSTKPVRETALAFSRVLQDIFRQVAVIPFSFPTLLGEAELMAFLREHASHYREDLIRLRNSVQMEVQVSFQQPTPRAAPSNQSGLDYLHTRQLRRQKLEAAVQRFRDIGEHHINDWRQRDNPAGIRGYALIARDAVPAFLEAIGGVALSSELRARVSGPWPASEFLTEN